MAVASSRRYPLRLERPVSALRAPEVDGAGIDGLATSLYPRLTDSHARRLGGRPLIGFARHPAEGRAQPLGLSAGKVVEMGRLANV